MSDPRAKAERSKAKDARQIPVLDKETKRKPSKKIKPFTVMYKWVKPTWFKWAHDWRLMGRYRTKEIAEKAISDSERKHPDYYEYQLTERII